MTRTRLAWLVVALLVTFTPIASGRDGAASPAAVSLFLARTNVPLTSYRARRHLEANNTRFKKHAWLDCVTRLDENGFSYEVTASDGSPYILRKVLLAALDAERDLTRARPSAGFVDANYEMTDDGADGEWLRIKLHPRRRDTLLLDGWLLVSPTNGALIEARGRLAKAPSFWTTRVEIVRRHRQIAGVTVPVLIESVASVRIAGPSSFSMRYDYDAINGIAVGE
jgi:hypothetical protein